MPNDHVLSAEDDAEDVGYTHDKIYDNKCIVK